MKKSREASVSGGVQAIERALILLEQLATMGTWVGVSELSQATNQPVGTVHRLLMTLMARGYVAQNEQTRRYRLGPACHFLAGQAQTPLDWQKLATPLLQQLVELSGETAHLAILKGNYATYVAQAQPTRLVRMFTALGEAIPLHASACGKVLLAHQPEQIVALRIGQLDLPALTSTTITDAERLRQELSLVKARGYAIDNGEQEEGVRCLSVPVFGPAVQVQAAISISGPSSRLDEQRMLGLFPQLKRVSADLSSALTV